MDGEMIQVQIISTCLDHAEDVGTGEALLGPLAPQLQLGLDERVGVAGFPVVGLERVG